MRSTAAPSPHWDGDPQAAVGYKKETGSACLFFLSCLRCGLYRGFFKRKYPSTICDASQPLYNGKIKKEPRPADGALRNVCPHLQPLFFLVRYNYARCGAAGEKCEGEKIWKKEKALDPILDS